MKMNFHTKFNESSSTATGTEMATTTPTSTPNNHTRSKYVVEIVARTRNYEQVHWISHNFFYFEKFLDSHIFLLHCKKSFCFRFSESVILVLKLSLNERSHKRDCQFVMQQINDVISSAAQFQYVFSDLAWKFTDGLFILLVAFQMFF